VIKWDPLRNGGFGLITCNDGEKFVVTWHQVRPDDRPLRAGQRVTFFAEDGSPLRRAANIELEPDSSKDCSQ
jgi:cold shock CspA family protein